MSARKTGRRLSLIESLEAALTDRRQLSAYNLRGMREREIHNALYPGLREAVAGYYAVHHPTVNPEIPNQKADMSVMRESDPRHVINHVQFLGTQHRPDYVIAVPQTRVAIEMKRAQTGTAIREGLGQALVYAFHYDFVLYLMIDTTVDGRIVRAARQPSESRLLELLWDELNIRLLTYAA